MHKVKYNNEVISLMSPGLRIAVSDQCYSKIIRRIPAFNLVGDDIFPSIMQDFVTEVY